MPLYEIEHHISLRDNQKDSLARQITLIHSRLFATPSLFVNVKFLEMTAAGRGGATYVGGKKRNLNRILAHVRPGTSCANSTHTLAHHPARSPEDFAHLCDLVTEAWNRCINDRNTAHRPTELHGMFVLGDIIAGVEAGFGLPAAGEDRAWLAANYGKFNERAKYGDQDFKDLLQEMKERPDLREEIPPTYDSAMSPSSPNQSSTSLSSPNLSNPGLSNLSLSTSMSPSTIADLERIGQSMRRGGERGGGGSPRIGELGFERDAKR